MSYRLKEMLHDSVQLYFLYHNGPHTGEIAKGRSLLGRIAAIRMAGATGPGPTAPTCNFDAPVQKNRLHFFVVFRGLVERQRRLLHARRSRQT